MVCTAYYAVSGETQKSPEIYSYSIQQDYSEQILSLKYFEKEN